MAEHLTIAEAAATVGVSPQALRERIRRGTLKATRTARNGRAIVVLDPAELARAYDSADKGLAKAGDKVAQAPCLEPEAPARGPQPSAAELELLRLELTQAREELANLRGQLEMSAKVEAAAQRAADKLEARLDAARREALTLARALGAAEGDRDRMRLQLEAPRGWLRRLLGR
jgi:DNA-binding transcriptional MerR regulator